MKKYLMFIVLSGCVAATPFPVATDAGTADTSQDTSSTCRVCMIFADRTVCEDLNCDDHDPCTADLCDSKFGCVHEPSCK